MNITVTSKDAILVKIREIVSSKGLNALSIRGLAKELDCSVGTIYYYFSSKDELILEAIESVWEDIFKVENMHAYTSFVDFLKNIFAHIASGTKKYPNFFTLHSVMLQTDEKTKAKSSMSIYMAKLKEIMKEVLSADAKVNKNAFDENFCSDDFISFIMSNIMSLILDQDYNKDFFISVVEKILY